MRRPSPRSARGRCGRSAGAAALTAAVPEPMSVLDEATARTESPAPRMDGLATSVSRERGRLQGLAARAHGRRGPAPGGELVVAVSGAPQGRRHRDLRDAHCSGRPALAREKAPALRRFRVPFQGQDGIDLVGGRAARPARRTRIDERSLHHPDRCRCLCCTALPCRCRPRGGLLRGRERRVRADAWINP